MQYNYNYCNSCTDGFGASSGSCIPCTQSNCGFCSADAYSCTGCAAGYAFGVNGTC